MPADADLYEALGVAKTATEDEIRRSYRKLARQHHPDVNPGKIEAENKFKAISAAYDVLCHRERRALYDEFGHEGLRGGFDPAEARAYKRWTDGRQAGRKAASGAAEESFKLDHELRDFVGKARARQHTAPIDGEHILATVELSLASALHGAEVELQVPMRATCETCSGYGAHAKQQPESCPACQGSGRTQVVRGPMCMNTNCQRCRGTGKLKVPCEHCQGQGWIDSEQTLRVRIPAGADSGDELRVRGQGKPGRFGGAPGDVVIRTQVQPHPYFQRTGLDLRLKLPITLIEAYCGGLIKVPTPSGPVEVKIAPHTQQGSQLRLKGKGVARGGTCGDLYVVLDVRPPDADAPALNKLIRATSRFYSRDVRKGVEL